MGVNVIVQYTKVSYPCTKDCPNRKMLCHNTCEAYIKAHNERQKELAEQDRIKKHQQDVYSIGREMQYRLKKRHRKD